MPQIPRIRRITEEPQFPGRGPIADVLPDIEALLDHIMEPGLLGKMLLPLPPRASTHLCGAVLKPL